MHASVADQPRRGERFLRGERTDGKTFIICTGTRSWFAMVRNTTSRVHITSGVFTGVDDETICASYDSWEIIRTFTSAFVNSEIPAIAQSPIGIDIERQHVQAVGVVQKQRLLIAAQRNPVRSLDRVCNFDRFAAHRDVVHSGRKARGQRLTCQSSLYGLGLGSVQARVGKVHAACLIDDQIVGATERHSKLSVITVSVPGG